MYILPTSNDAADDDYSFDAQLEPNGDTFTLSFHWSYRNQFWYMTLIASDGSNVVSGIKLTAGTAPMNWYQDFSKAPLGLFLVYDSSNSDTDPGRFDLQLNARCQLCYFTLADLAAIYADPQDTATLEALGLAP